MERKKVDDQDEFKAPADLNIDGMVLSCRYPAKSIALWMEGSEVYLDEKRLNDMIAWLQDVAWLCYRSEY